MKKSNSIFKALGISLVAGLIALFAACTNNETVKSPVKNAGISQQAARSATSQSISLEDAIEIALNDAGVSRENASFIKTQLEKDNKNRNYEIEFLANDKVYDYKIAVNSGEILKKEQEGVEQPIDSNEPKAPETENKNSGYISVDDAIQAALEHLNPPEGSAVAEASFDGDDIIPHYDVEIHHNGYEYDYEINAKTGDVIAYEIEFREENGHKNSAVTASSYISAEQAKEAALKHAGISAADAKLLKTELDTDGGIAHYNVEFKSDIYEYEYEINAKTGSVIASEKDIDD